MAGGAEVLFFSVLVLSSKCKPRVIPGADLGHSLCNQQLAVDVRSPVSVAECRCVRVWVLGKPRSVWVALRER